MSFASTKLLKDVEQALGDETLDFNGLVFVLKEVGTVLRRQRGLIVTEPEYHRAVKMYNGVLGGLVQRGGPGDVCLLNAIPYNESLANLPR